MYKNSHLRQVGGFLWALQFPPPKKTDHQDITEILLKVVLNTINLYKNRPVINKIILDHKYIKSSILLEQINADNEDRLYDMNQNRSQNSVSQ